MKTTARFVVVGATLLVAALSGTYTANAERWIGDAASRLLGTATAYPVAPALTPGAGAGGTLVVVPPALATMSPSG